IVGGFRFELSKLTVPAIRVRMVASLRNVDEDLAAQVAEGLGMDLPDPLPRVLERPRKPEVMKSPALSLTALPGDVGVRSRKIAILVANGVVGASLESLHAALTDAGAVPRFIGPRLGTYSTSDGDTIEADASMENSPPVLFDALILPDGAAGVKALAADGHTMEFITNQFRHGKTILALGASNKLMEKAGIAVTAKSDAGLLLMRGTEKNVAQKFMSSVTKHRFPERETDPPLV
ncbi:MAG: DJ-1/PfpI family protein, partial [bacterium]